MTGSETEGPDRFLEVYHSDQYGFGGNTRIKIAVFEETEDELRGRRYHGQGETGLGVELVIRKDNVAGWKEHVPLKIPRSADTLKEEYARGKIDEEELEEELEDARL